jgi:FkbM family methyltransferase
VVRRLGRAFRSLAPDREVRRVVQGTELRLPWSHRLPDYVAVHPTYGLNVVDLAHALSERTDGPLHVLDVGANVGDTALQILDRVDARVLCVEGDPYWLTWLRRNVRSHERVAVEPSLVGVGDTTPLSPVRHGGTTRFVPAASSGSAPVCSPGELRARHPGFAGVRLVKCDTDGFDVPLVPALAAAWDSRPVVFFEYDHRLSRLAGHDPVGVWPALAGLGYVEAGVWDNHGRPLGRVPLSEMRERSALQDRRHRGWDYWDVAVVHADDPEGAAALAAVLPGAWTSQVSRGS